ncbi:hypothetical protein [Enterobacter cloacae complex sp. 284J4]
MNKKFSSKIFLLIILKQQLGRDITWIGICGSLEEHFGKKPSRQALSDMQ